MKIIGCKTITAWMHEDLDDKLNALIDETEKRGDDYELKIERQNSLSFEKPMTDKTMYQHVAFATIYKK